MSVNGCEEATLCRHLVRRFGVPKLLRQLTEGLASFTVSCSLTWSARDPAEQAFAVARADLPAEQVPRLGGRLCSRRPHPDPGRRYALGIEIPAS